MMNYVFFTEKDTNESVAVNVRNVNLVRNTEKSVQLTFFNNSVLYLNEEFLDVVSRLNNP